MKKASFHIPRVQSVIQAALGDIISREINIKTFGLVTISQVRVSKDLAVASVYVIGHDPSKKNELVQFLKSNAKEIRHLLAQRIDLRKTPELKFYYDDVQEQGIRISKLLNNSQEGE